MDLTPRGLNWLMVLRDLGVISGIIHGGLAGCSQFEPATKLMLVASKPARVSIFTSMPWHTGVNYNDMQILRQPVGRCKSELTIT